MEDSNFLGSGADFKVLNYVTVDRTSTGLQWLSQHAFGTWISGAATFFFFQAEDGIRDLTVTRVQTCALPIFHHHHHLLLFLMIERLTHRIHPIHQRSEERRVGKSVDLGGRRIIKKKKKKKKKSQCIRYNTKKINIEITTIYQHL